MSQLINRQVTLASRPQGEPKAENFKIIDGAVRDPGDGEVLLQTVYLSLDPYMRGRMSEGKSYAQPLQVGDVMEGGAVSKVIESANSGYKVGEYVIGNTGWQTYTTIKGEQLVKVDNDLGPLSTAVGVLGMPGMTAYTGLLNIGRPKAGETLVVAAASGPVGATVGQIAKLKGCRTVGVAGGQAKCDYVVKELGFDACIDHKDADFAAKLKAACPKGIDIYFENVGGAVFDAVLPLLNDFARVPVCGVISGYNGMEPGPGLDRTQLLLKQILVSRLHLQGFIVSDYGAQREPFLRDVSEWIKDGKIKYREDIVDGLDKAPEAFMGLLKGKNFGKVVVAVSKP